MTMKRPLYFMGVIMLSLSAQINSAEAATRLNDHLYVRLSPSEIPPFNKNSSVDMLYTTIEPILGQLVYTTSSYDLEPGLLDSFHCTYHRSPTMYFHRAFAILLVRVIRSTWKKM